jgi:hypothetical protein
MMSMRRFPILFGAIAAGLLLLSCSNDPLSDLTYEDSQVFFTNRDRDINFKDYKSFSIVDSVYVISNQGEGKSLSEQDRSMLTRLIHNMQQLGYQYVGPADNPDVGLSVELVDNRYLNLVQVPMGGYWGSYWGGYGGWGMGMPSYYSYQQVQELYWTVNMLDLKNPDTTNQKLRVIWNAQIRGEGLYQNNLIPRMVDNLFAQSTYLKPN